jgi:hypothetical protein
MSSMIELTFCPLARPCGANYSQVKRFVSITRLNVRFVHGVRLDGFHRHTVFAHAAQHATSDYCDPVIKSFKHNGLRKFFQTGSTAGIQPKHKVKLADQLDLLDSAVTVQDMDVPGWQLHELKGELRK